jgi:hypothetical protein
MRIAGVGGAGVGGVRAIQIDASMEAITINQTSASAQTIASITSMTANGSRQAITRIQNIVAVLAVVDGLAFAFQILGFPTTGD